MGAPPPRYGDLRLARTSYAGKRPPVNENTLRAAGPEVVSFDRRHRGGHAYGPGDAGQECSRKYLVGKAATDATVRGYQP